MKKWILLLSILTCGKAMAQPVTYKVMSYNLLAFGLPCTGVTITQKYTWLGTILNHAQPDIFSVNEVSASNASIYAEGIRQQSFPAAIRSQIAFPAPTNQAGSDRVNVLFYRKDKFGYLGGQVIVGGIRDVNLHKFYVKTATAVGDTTFLYCIQGHFKAGDTQNDATDRNLSATAIMNWVSAQGRNASVLLMGDFNLYSPNEQAFQTLVFNNDQAIRFRDPAGLQGGWTGASHALFHTQSPRSSSSDCGSGGGMDDRFDFILTSPALTDGLARVGIVPDSYATYGNNGQSYNTELSCSGNTTVPAQVCNTLKLMSDHLPVVLQIRADAVNALDLLPESEARLWLPDQPGSSLEIHFEAVIPAFYQIEVYDALGRRVAWL
ncbi:MAG: endonuclease/exonuclease/phosphatase family protein, partial [Bacteroidetes bacterium]